MTIQEKELIAIEYLRALFPTATTRCCQEMIKIGDINYFDNDNRDPSNVTFHEIFITRAANWFYHNRVVTDKKKVYGRRR